MAERFISIVKIALPEIIIIFTIALAFAKQNKKRATGDTSKDYAILGAIIGLVIGTGLGHIIDVLDAYVCATLGILIGYIIGSGKKKKQ